MTEGPESGTRNICL